MTFMMTSRKSVVVVMEMEGLWGICKFQIKLYHSVSSLNHKFLSLHKSHTELPYSGT